MGKGFEIEKYLPVPDKPGFVRFHKMATYREVYEAVKAHLKEVKATASPSAREGGSSLYDTMEWFEIDYEKRQGNGPNKEIPRFAHMACYAFPGTNEGAIVHVEAIEWKNPDKRTLILHGKTLYSLAQAMEIANAITAFIYQEMNR